MSAQIKNPLRAAETVPSVEGGVSAIASATAPFVYFDGVAAKGLTSGGVAQITLMAARLNLEPSSNDVLRDHVVTAHLRCSLLALRDLRDQINDVLAASEPIDRSLAN